MTFIPLSVFLWHDIADHVFDGVEMVVLRAGALLLYWPTPLVPFLSSTVFHCLLFLPVGWYCGAGVFGLIGCQSLSPGLAMATFLITIRVSNNRNNNHNKANNCNNNNYNNTNNNVGHHFDCIFFSNASTVLK